MYVHKKGGEGMVGEAELKVNLCLEKVKGKQWWFIRGDKGTVKVMGFSHVDYIIYIFFRVW